jgi:hypothetical protein
VSIPVDDIGNLDPQVCTEPTPVDDVCDTNSQVIIVSIPVGDIGNTDLQVCTEPTVADIGDSNLHVCSEPTTVDDVCVCDTHQAPLNSIQASGGDIETDDAPDASDTEPYSSDYSAGLDSQV